MMVAAAAAAVSVLAVVATAGAAGAAGPGPAVLTGLACRSTSQCVAVGVSTQVMATRLLSNKWNGSRWSQVAVPTPSGAGNVQEGGVSCPSATECVAVGDAFPPRGGAYYATANYWNGARWTTGRAANLGTSSRLEAVSCPSTSSCFAVGEYGTASPTGLPLIEHWNGRNWTRQAAPFPAGIGQGMLEDVSCASAALCVAVGTSENSTAIEDRWNGHAWSTTSLPNARNVSLYGVSCHTTTCFAVGVDNNGRSAGTYRLTSTTWSYLRAPAPAGATFPALESVSCPTASRCLAVGNYGFDGVFADAWNGHAWVGVPVHQSGGVVHDFEQVSCVSWPRCMALGSVSPIGAGWRSESAYWNGSSWKITLTA
jgi:hypothetical protein